MTAIKLAVVGATGRMGQRLARLIGEAPDTVLVAALDREEAAGIPVGELAATADPRSVLLADVVIDFSAPAAIGATAGIAASGGVGYVLASTGLSGEQQAQVTTLSERCGVVQAANFSTGVNVLLEAVEIVAQRLRGEADVEISEIHHRHKRDAPSGTALALGDAVRVGAPQVSDFLGRCDENHPREARELGYAPIRGGDVSGDHTVYFLGEGERIELTHRSTSADIFAAGAIRAARWLVGRSPGLYSMRDVLRG